MFRKHLFLFYLSSFLITALPFASHAEAGQLTLTWTDNSTNENGFKIERKLGTNGTYAQIATVGANTMSYVDAALTNGNTYCYQVSAYNSAGNSPSSNVSCGVVPTTTSAFTLTVTKSGTGSGTISSNPAGINCGATCSANFSSGTIVTLTATPGEVSVFSGWSGGGCSGTGTCTLTLNSNINVTATFSPKSGSTQNFTLSVAKNGTGSGTISSNPAGINCGATCSAAFASATSVALTATAASGSVFSGWSGGGCSGIGICTVAVNSNTTVTATFSVVSSQTFMLSATKSGEGNGTVTSNPAGINCGTACSASFPPRTRITLSATPNSSSAFDHWAGACKGTSTCTIKLGANTQVVAYFKPKAGTLTVQKMGPGSGTVTSTELGISCGAKCSESYSTITAGTVTAKAAPGSTFAGWTGEGCQSSSTCAVLVDSNTTVAAIFVKNPSFHLGLFRANNSRWLFDLDGNGTWDDCSVDLCLGPFGKEGDMPVVGDWDGSGLSKIGVFNPASGTWQLDLNGNGTWDDCSVDLCLGTFGKKGKLPVVGDWDGSGFSRIGVFNPASGTWQLDLNGNGTWDDCSVDLCLGPFGKKGDVPVVGDWDGSGLSKISVFNPASGTWQLDLNGNGTWDDCSVDLCLGPLGQKGDVPVVGKW